MQLKSLIRYPMDIRRARRILGSKSTQCTANLVQRPIALDLRTPQMLFDCGRHLASIAHHAASIGSPFFVRSNPVLLAAFTRKVHGREMLAAPQTQWVPASKSLPDDALVLTDHSSSTGIEMLIGRDLIRSLPVMPYPMHPATQHHADRPTLESLRQMARAGILFAGNQKLKYGDAKIKRNFGVLSRLEILTQLADEHPDRVVKSIGERSDSERIVIADSRTETIDASDWLPTLAQFQFFLCCPGAAQPTCHNLIEAMSVGTIPIVEYGDRVTPQLQDGVNAVCFRGQQGLRDAIERIVRYSNDELTQLSRSAARFYDQHLCGDRFLKQLRDGELDLTEGKICLPFHEHNLFAPQARQAA